MCKNKTELYKAVSEYKKLLRQKAELEQRITELKEDIIPYIEKNGVPNPKSKNKCLVCYSRDYKVSYILCTRVDPDRDKLKAFLGDSYDAYTKSTTYDSLRVS